MASPDPTAHGLEAVFANSASWVQTSRALQRIARSVVGDDDAAEDIVQNAWVEVLERKHARLGLGRLRRLVQSRSIDVLRRRAREPKKIGPKAAENVPHEDDVLGSKLEVQRVVLEAVDSLGEPYRTTVYLRYFEGLGPKAIAKQLSVPEKTIKTRLTRAHQLLRERLCTRFQERDGTWAPALLDFAGVPLAGLSVPLLFVASTLLMKKTAFGALAVLALFASWVVFTSIRGGTTSPSGLSAASSVANSEADVSQLEAGPRGEKETHRETVALGPILVDEPSPAARNSGSLRVKVRRKHGAPARTVHVVATTERDPYFLRRKFRRQTDDAGVAFFEALPVGTVSLITDRGRGSDKGIEIRPGETTEATLAIPEGVHVIGRVHDAEKQPVAGAGVWLTSSSGGWTSGAIVARTDGSGRFEIEDVPDGQSIGAIAAGFQPSSLVDLDLVDTTSKRVTIELALVPGGASLSGIVREDTGEPIEGALVAVGDNSRLLSMRVGQSMEESWSPRTTRTDAEGRYRFVGLPTGTQVVQVRSLEYALWGGSVELAAGSREELNVTLTHGVIVRGTVTNAEGDVVPGAAVLAFHEPLRETYLQGGQVDYDGPFTGPAAITDEDGTYELRQVSSGAMSFYALEPRQDPADIRATLRFAVAHLTLSPHSETTWNPVLADGRVIEGRTLYSDGEAIRGVYVILEGTSESEGRVTFSEEGHYRFLNLGEGPFTIRVQMWSRPEGIPDPSVEGVFPSDSPVDIVAAFKSPQETDPASVRVRFVEEGRPSRGEASVVIESEDGNSWRFGKSNGDEWTFELHEPGVYRAVALYGERVICTGGDFEVQGGESIDLPDLVAGPGGTLVLTIQRPDDPVPTGLRAFLRRKASKGAESFELGGQTELRIDHLEPGTGHISFLGDNIQQLALEFEVRAGEETHLTVPLTAAVPVRYHIEWPSQESTGTMSIRILDRRTSALVDGYEIADLTEYSSPISWNAYLPIGSYTFEVKKNGTLHQSEGFEVTSLDPKKAPKLGFK